MPIYEIESPDGQVLEITGSKPPSKSQLDKIFAAAKDKVAPPLPPTQDEIDHTASTPRIMAGEKRGATNAQQLDAALLDMLSTPGRLVAAAGAGLIPGGDTFKESFARTRGKEGTGAGGFVGSVVRDPATLPTVGAGGIGVATGKGLVTRMAQGAAKGVAEGVVSAGIHEGERSAAGEESDLKSAGIETVASGILGGAGPAVGEFAKKVGGGIRKQATKLANVAFSPTKATIKKGFKPEYISKHDLSGSFDQVVTKSSKKLDELDSQVDELITGAIKSNPDAVIHPGEIIDGILDELEQSNIDDLIWDKEVAMKAAETFSSILSDKGYLDDLGLGSVRTVKGILKKKAFKKGVQSDDLAVKERVAREIYDRLKVKLEEFVPDIKTPNRDMFEIIAVRDAAEDIAERVGKKSEIATRSNFATLIAAFIGGSSVGGLPGGGTAAVTALTAKKLFEKGRGAAFTDATGRALQKAPELIKATTPQVGALLRGGLTKQQMDDLNKSRSGNRE